MPRGGKRANAGRKPGAEPMARTLTTRLSGVDAEILDMLTEHFQCSESEAVRRALRALSKATLDGLIAQELGIQLR